MTDLFTPAPGDAPKIAETPLVFCGQCAHHDLTGELGVHGYGLCNARPQHQRAGHFTSAENKCRTGKFTPKQPPKGT